MRDTFITARQLKRLQTLWGLFCRQGRLDPRDRLGRLGWLAGQVGRQLVTSKDLTRAEAEKVIDALQACLPKDQVRKRPGRAQAQALGTAGRRGMTTKVVLPPDPGQLARIQDLRGKLGWSAERFDLWMRSGHGPLRGRATIRTMGDANAVAWGLKRILKAQQQPAAAGLPSGPDLDAAAAEKQAVEETKQAMTP